MLKKSSFLLIVFILTLAISSIEAGNSKTVNIYKKINITTIAEVVHFKKLPLMAKTVVKYLLYSEEIGLKNIYRISNNKSRKELNIKILQYEKGKFIKFQIFLSDMGEGKVIELKLYGRPGEKLNKKTRTEKALNKEMWQNLSRVHGMSAKEIVQFQRQVKLIVFGIDKYVTKHWDS
ncbi:MAG TPA: hypothetical protein ENI73_07360 [Spirochaetes bacterium]|nr:hypothetical protein [Spirochaetota bacterium]